MCVCIYFFFFFFMYVCMYLYASYFMYIFIQHVSSFFFFKLAQFAVTDFNLNVIIRILSDMLPAVIYIVEFNLFFYNTKVVSRKIRFPWKIIALTWQRIQLMQIKRMLEQVMNNWRMLTDIREIKIMEYYTLQGRHFTIFLVCKQ